MNLLINIIKSIIINENLDDTKIIFYLMRLRSINIEYIYNIINNKHKMYELINLVLRKKLICEIIIKNYKGNKNSMNFKRHIYRYNLLNIFSSKNNMIKLLIRFKEIHYIWDYLYDTNTHLTTCFLCHFENPKIIDFFGFKDRCTALFDIFMLEHIPTIYTNKLIPYNSLIP